MRSIDILNAVGEVDDEYVTKAKAKKTSYKKVWIALGSSLAACLALFLAVPIMFAMRGASALAPGTAAPPEIDTAAEYGDVRIVYVTDGKTRNKTQSMYYKPEEVFAAWREANGLGDEVEFVKCEIKYNGKTTKMPGGGTLANHEADHFTLNLTISKNIEDYYDHINSELLLQSLKDTMTEFLANIKHDDDHLMLVCEYHLILEPETETETAASVPGTDASTPGEAASLIEYIDEKHQNADHELTLVYDDAKIFYVADGKISSKTQSMYLSAENAFIAWREANGIGDEVEFVKCEIKDNSTDRTVTIDGETFTEHIMGDYFILNVTISKRIEDYYDHIDSELLLDSLKQTMTGYLDIDFDEYHLILV